MKLALGLFLFGTFCSGPALCGPAPIETRQATRGGATFALPASWTIVRQPEFAELAPPENTAKVALVEVAAKTPDDAVAAAWKVYRPAEHLRLRATQEKSPRSGWVERWYFEYETAAAENAVVYALAWRGQDGWLVSILHADNAVYEKRAAGFSLLFSSLRAKGFVRENFSGKKPRPLDAARIELLRGFVDKAMRELAIPGAALGLIDAGKIVFVGGFGVRELGKSALVNADTRFMAASNTKALTTLLLARLVDERRLRWDEAVTEAYPGFKLGDATTTQRVLIKHLVCACTGLPQQNLEWLFNSRVATPASSLALLGTMQPTSDFGEIYQYSNLMAAAAGYVAAYALDHSHELGKTYDDAMRRKIFSPLRMDRTTFDFSKAMADNYTSPHGEDIHGKTAVARIDINMAVAPVRPAGGAWTSARDLSRYVQMELAEGMLPSGRRLVSKTNLLARRVPQVSTGEDEAYGMGLVINTKMGVPIIDHGGSQFGYKSDMVFLPEQGVGMVILTNADSGEALNAPLARRLIELLFDANEEAELQLMNAAAVRRQVVAEAHADLASSLHADDIAGLARRYESPELGRLTVASNLNETYFDFGTWRSAVSARHKADHATTFVTIDPAVDGYDFVSGEKMGKKTLTIHDAQHSYTFTEIH
jgi:CubicO group peptidase (beta-lactamase class C family)